MARRVFSKAELAKYKNFAELALDLVNEGFPVDHFHCVVNGHVDHLNLTFKVAWENSTLAAPWPHGENEVWGHWDAGQHRPEKFLEIRPDQYDSVSADEFQDPEEIQE